MFVYIHVSKHIALVPYTKYWFKLNWWKMENCSMVEKAKIAQIGKWSLLTYFKLNEIVCETFRDSLNFKLNAMCNLRLSQNIVAFHEACQMFFRFGVPFHYMHVKRVLFDFIDEQASDMNVLTSITRECSWAIQFNYS